MEDANYREISQQYAQGSIKAAAALNCGAAIAALSQASTLVPLVGTEILGISIIVFVVGATLSALTWASGFLSTRYVDRKLRSQEATYKLADRWMFVGLSLNIASILAFLVGSMLIGCSFLNAQLTVDPPS